MILMCVCVYVAKIYKVYIIKLILKDLEGTPVLIDKRSKTESSQQLRSPP